MGDDKQFDRAVYDLGTLGIGVEHLNRVTAVDDGLPVTHINNCCITGSNIQKMDGEVPRRGNHG